MERNLVKSFETLGKEAYGASFSGDQIVDDLAKALTTTTGNAYTLSSQPPLLLENLDATMTAVLFQHSHLKIFNSIPRVPSAQTLYQWIRELQYGNARGGLGFVEGGSPVTGASNWQRGNIMVKFYGVRRGYTHQMLQVGMAGGSAIDPVARENRNGTLDLLGKLERFLMFGDSSQMDNSGNSVHYDGLIKQVTSNFSANIIDKAGSPLDFEDLENYAEDFVRTGKLLDFSQMRTIWKPRVLTDLAKLKVQAERKPLSESIPGYRPGTPLDGYRTQHGNLAFEESIFLDAVEDGKVNNSQGSLISDTSAPATPTSGSFTITGSTSGGNMPDGTYYYWVSAINDNGESAVTHGTGLVAAAGFTVTISGGSGNGSVAFSTIPATTGATGYRIYRSLVNSALDPSTGWIATVYPSAVGGSVTSYVDINQWIPQSGFGILMNCNESDVALAQLAPLIKFPLAVTSTTLEFLLILYHVLAVKAAERIKIVKNIGQRA